MTKISRTQYIIMFVMFWYIGHIQESVYQLIGSIVFYLIFDYIISLILDSYQIGQKYNNNEITEL